MATQATFIQTETHEKYTVPWTISNFFNVVDSHRLFAFETLQFELGPSGSLESKWEARLAPNSTQTTLVMFLKILEQNQSAPVSSVQVEIECISAGTPKVNKQLVKFETNVPFMIRENKVFETNLPLSPYHKIWRNLNVTPGDNLKITFTIIFPVVTPVESSISAKNKLVKSSTANLKEGLLKLSEDEKLNDVKIVCSDGQEFAAHPLVLSARNPVLDTMLGTELMDGTSGVIKVADFTGATMNILLHFFCTGELIDGWQKPEVIHEFVYAAGKYQLEDVLEILDSMLGTEKVTTCDVRLLSLANKLGLKNADARIAAKLGKLFSQVKTGDEMMKLLSNGINYFSGKDLF